MSNIYLTFVSDVTKDYASNVANKFKVKPNLRLHGEGWHVSIAWPCYLKWLYLNRYKVRMKI